VGPAKVGNRAHAGRGAIPQGDAVARVSEGRCQGQSAVAGAENGDGAESCFFLLSGAAVVCRRWIAQHTIRTHSSRTGENVEHQYSRILRSGPPTSLAAVTGALVVILGQRNVIESTAATAETWQLRAIFFVAQGIGPARLAWSASFSRP
jgi:hypothetical protein